MQLGIKPALAALVLIGLSGCSAPPQAVKPAVTTPTPLPTLTPLPLQTAEPPPTVPPGPIAPIPPRPTPYPRLPIPAGTARCHTSQLEVAFIDTYAAMSKVLNNFDMRNRSRTACWVYGYVGFQLLDGRYRPLPQTVSWTTETFFIRFDPPSRILLPPGTAALGSKQGSGHAFFNVEADDFTCPNSQFKATVNLKIWPPDEYQALVIPAKPGEFGFISCNGLAVHPLQVQPHPSAG
jgi:hypothetical protein